MIQMAAVWSSGSMRNYS